MDNHRFPEQGALMRRRALVSILIVLCSSLSLATAAEDPEKGTEPTRVRIFERSANHLAVGTVRMIGDAVHVPLKLLIDEMGLEQKPVGEGRIGICRGDLCIPFDVAEKDGALRRDGQTLWVPVAPLVEALGGHFTWDANAKALLLDLSDVHRAATWAVGAPFELQLPDLEGNSVSVERYRGRKVLLYAWASW